MVSLHSNKTITKTPHLVMPQGLFLLWMSGIFYTSISLLRIFLFVSEGWHENFEWNSIGSVDYLVKWSLSQL